MFRNTSHYELTPALQALNKTLDSLRAKQGLLTNTESRFVKQMELVNKLVRSGCEKFKLHFKISEAYWLQSSIKYDESHQLYSSIHRAYSELLESSMRPVSSRYAEKKGLDSLLA